MRIDLYTKVCLTVIALSLSVIAFKDTPPIQKAYADSSIHYEIYDLLIDIESTVKGGIQAILYNQNQMH